MFRNKSVDVHRFSMIPSADVPRSSFQMESMYKTTFDAGYLIPVYVDEVLPGDTFSVRMTAFARLATPLFPVLDNMHLDSFFFFIPNRLVWDNWVRFMGEQRNPGDSISFVVPQMVCPASGYAIGTLQDYMGLPTVGQVAAAATVSHSSLPLRAYNLVWNEWFRDENLQNSLTVDHGDGPDTYSNYVLKRRGKRHDYFTSALPWPQKGSTAVTLPLGTSAPVVPVDSASFPTWKGGTVNNMALQAQNGVANVTWNPTPNGSQNAYWVTTGLVADLQSATAATINQLRQAFQIQRLLERDARGGTRYTELVRSHFGVQSPDARLQRPEYLGGGSTVVSINPVAQTSATTASGSDTPLGNLGAMGTALARGHGFTQSFTEHGILLGLISVRADLTYQQGLRKMWSRSTRYDFYFPAFAHLGEQAILNKELYVRGDGNDNLVFGYQERWAEYRYNPSLITGLFRSTASGTVDAWHLAQKFTSLPALNSTFIEDTPPVSRVVAVGAAANGKQFLLDALLSIRAARPLPAYSVPGFIDRF